ncbi:Putative aromatic-ring-hydroxylating dioxygenase, alpha subunit, rieske [2Fe-2S] iron-sulfur [Septoria linicola]|uniref:Choline monooxygenase, chloroplastic n=1 Tax=Septoria linicola TaxID=215465 RepID=A0A9Q9AIY3_9PEZI|nr:Putative aromatic-ring-hydroxylating dioxygenase, alpha subunit, rieske [2Fe-2S] iron-sulfur [Septoria linicola]
MSTKPKSRGPQCTSPYTDGKAGSMASLPASWFTSSEMYDLERRAIFSKKWMLTTHQIRLPIPGDWIKFEIVGYEYVISRDRKGEIHAFHNACRHRGYHVVEGASGHNQILSCRYHGWSCALDGRLTKANWYEDIQGFDKNQNGLFKIHTRVDALGFVWVNLDSSETPEPWESEFDDIDRGERYNGYDLNDYVFDHEFEIDADTNWKLCSDNYNECYHCPTSHPGIDALLVVDKLTLDSNKGYMIAISPQNEQQKRDGLKLCATYWYPNVSTNILPNYIMLQRFLPRLVNRTRMHYQIFRNKNAKQELFDLIDKMYVKIMTEDEGLACGVQKNMEHDLYVSGQLHPRVESASLHMQARTREIVKEHAKREEAAGHQIWPAKPVLTLDENISEKIAPVLVTADDAHNSWRCLLLPIAHASDLVRRAVISAAAGHAPAATSNTKISTSYAYQQVIHELRRRQDLEAESLLGKQHIVLTLLVLLAKAIVDGSQDFRSVFNLLETLLRTVKDRKAFHSGEIGTFILAQVSKFRGYAALFLSRSEAITILSTCTAGGPPVNANWHEYNTSRNLYPSLNICMSTMYEVDRRACDIYLARELLGPHTPALIEMVDDFRKTLAAVLAASPGEHTLAWAVFIVAIESGGYEHREVFIQFLRRHQRVRGFGSIGKAIEYIERIWAAHEQNDWVEQIMQLPLLVV